MVFSGSTIRRFIVWSSCLIWLVCDQEVVPLFLLHCTRGRYLWGGGGGGEGVYSNYLVFEILMQMHHFWSVNPCVSLMLASLSARKLAKWWGSRSQNHHCRIRGSFNSSKGRKILIVTFLSNVQASSNQERRPTTTTVDNMMKYKLEMVDESFLWTRNYVEHKRRV